MINRRSFIALTSAGVATAVVGTRIGFAQDDNSANRELQNASFVRGISDESVATPASTPDATPASALDLEDLRGYILGDPAAPNTLQLYADYRCPHCRAFHTDIEPGLLQDFVNTGRMNIEIFDFTVIGVPDFDSLGDDTIESVQAAEAAACAAEQGAYLEYREWLYDGELRTNDGDFSDENLIGAAEELGLDVAQFSSSLLNGVYEEGIIAMVSHGIERGVQGTPTMILNDGEPFYVPNGGYDQLRDNLESRLN